MRHAAQLAAPRATILCITNQHSLGSASFRKTILSGLENPGDWKFTSQGMPADFAGDTYLRTWWLQRG